jgi:isocitrate dehydrogenase (NAD+)
MLRYLGETMAANRIETAIRAVFTRGEARTADLGGSATTDQFVAAVLELMR